MQASPPPTRKTKNKRASSLNEWGAAALALVLMALAVVAYHQADVRVDGENMILAAIALGASGHVALAHVQHRLAGLHGAVVISLALIGLVAGVAAVMTAALTSEDTKVLGLALAGIAGAIAGAETLTRVATRALGDVSVSNVERRAGNLVLTGEGLADIETIKIGNSWTPAKVVGDTLTAPVPDGAEPGELVRVGFGDSSAQFALPEA